MNRLRSLSMLASLVALGLCLGGSAGADPPKAVAKPKAPVVIKAKSISASAKLKQAIAGKKPFVEAKVQAALSYNAKGFPRLKLAKSKRTVTLERVDVAEPVPPAKLLSAAAVIDPKLKTYQTHVAAPYLTFERPPKITLVPANVSHASRETGIKNQGERGTCVAHAAMAGIESWYKWKHDATRDLSEQHAFEIFMAKEGKKSCWDDGLQTWKAAGYLTTDRACSSWAYTAALPACDVTVPATCSSTASHGHTATQLLFATAQGGTGTQVAENTNYLESILAAGNDIVFGMYLAGSDWSDATIDTGVIDVQLVAGNPADAYAGHAMLMVGYDRAANYFELKNSWGGDSGHAGYVRVSYEYVQTYAKYGYYITGATAP